MRFDWYAATVRDDPHQVLGALADSLRADVVQGRGMHGYSTGYELRRDGSTVARMLAGGGNGNPHVWASGDDTDALVPIVRALWPTTHRVSRMDASQDFDGRGTWNRLYATTLAVADERRLAINQAGDWHRGEAGRTFYVGGTKSAVRARLYEKGKQLRAEALDGGADISPDLCRLEVQVRPEGHARTVAASTTPEGAYGFANWTQELARRVHGVDVERVHIKERRESDDERALEYLVRQYGGHIDRLALRLGGGWDDAGMHLWQLHKRNEARKGGNDA